MCARDARLDRDDRRGDGARESGFASPEGGPGAALVVDGTEGDEGGALEDAGGEGREEGLGGVVSVGDVEGLVEAGLALVEGEDFVDGHLLVWGWDI